MGIRRRRRRRRILAVGAIAHHEGVKRGEQQEAMAEDQAFAEPAPTDYAPPAADPADELEHLSQLHDSGALTDEEFAEAKAKALA